MQKVDFKEELKNLYSASQTEVGLVNVPKMNFIMIDGAGDPGTSEEFRCAVDALFNIAYTLKFMVKKKGTADYGVLPLEGRWWTEDMEKFNLEHKGLWKWTLMIMQPEYITRELFEISLEEVQRKKELSCLDIVRLESFHEGLAAQMLHIGPYSEEGPAIEMIHDFIKDRDHKFSGKHHEIYLNDPRKCSPENLKTIIRQPIKSL